MTKAARAALIAFEAEADAAMAALPIGALPARCHFAHFHAFIFHQLNHAGLRDPAARITGETMLSRVSYLLPWLRARDAQPLGESADDALGALYETENAAEDMINLTQYAHLCEIMPEVHRRRLTVEQTGEAAFRVSHPDAGFARAEATDIIMSELALNFMINPVRHQPDEEIFDLARTAPVLNQGQLRAVIARRIAVYRADLREDPLIHDGAMIAVFGFDRARFSEIQATIFGIVDVFQQLALVLWIWSTKDGAEPSKEALEWVSVCWTADGFLDVVEALSGQPRAEVAAFIEKFTFDYNRPPDEMRGGEGFTPPFVRLGDTLLFSSDMVFRFCQARNALVHLIRHDPALFDELISQDFEPVLIDLIAEALDGLPDIVIRRSFAFEGGEIDLIIANAVTNQVTIIEVKAPLPPQGSRMTQRLADRIREGVDQLTRIRDLPADQRRAIIEAATGLALEDPTYHYLIAARSCFGAIEVWDPASWIVPATLPLLRLAAQSIRGQGLDAAGDLAGELRTIADRIMGEAEWHWDEGEMTLFGRTLVTPQLIYDRAAVDLWMRRARPDAG